jgi:hypothetical protein
MLADKPQTPPPEGPRYDEQRYAMIENELLWSLPKQSLADLERDVWKFFTKARRFQLVGLICGILGLLFFIKAFDGLGALKGFIINSLLSWAGCTVFTFPHFGFRFTLPDGDSFSAYNRRAISFNPAHTRRWLEAAQGLHGEVKVQVSKVWPHQTKYALLIIGMPLFFLVIKADGFIVVSFVSLIGLCCEVIVKAKYRDAAEWSATEGYKTVVQILDTRVEMAPRRRG